MHEVMRQRLLRRIESLPEAQVYQVLDFIEFLESKYARAGAVEPSVLQKFAEGVEDKLRKQAMNPATLREAFQLIAAADRVLSDVSTAGKQILNELGGAPEPGSRGDLPPRKRDRGNPPRKSAPRKSAPGGTGPDSASPSREATRRGKSSGEETGGGRGGVGS